MSLLKICLLGKFSLFHNDRELDLQSAKAKELFCYLMLHRDRVHAREVWPACSGLIARRPSLRSIFDELSGSSKKLFIVRHPAGKSTCCA